MEAVREAMGSGNLRRYVRFRGRFLQVLDELWFGAAQGLEGTELGELVRQRRLGQLDALADLPSDTLRRGLLSLLPPASDLPPPLPDDLLARLPALFTDSSQASSDQTFTRPFAFETPPPLENLAPLATVPPVPVQRGSPEPRSADCTSVRGYTFAPKRPSSPMARDAGSPTPRTSPRLHEAATGASAKQSRPLPPSPGRRLNPAAPVFTPRQTHPKPALAPQSSPPVPPSAPQMRKPAAQANDPRGACAKPQPSNSNWRRAAISPSTTRPPSRFLTLRPVDPKEAGCGELERLCGLYGEVRRVWQYAGRREAAVEFATADGAAKARHLLSAAVLWDDQPLQVESTVTSVGTPSDRLDVTGLARGEKVSPAREAFGPTWRLTIASLPPSTTVAQLRVLFRSLSLPAPAKLKLDGALAGWPRRAFAEFASVAEATSALARLRGRPLSPAQPSPLLPVFCRPRF